MPARSKPARSRLYPTALIVAAAVVLAGVPTVAAPHNKCIQNHLPDPDCLPDEGDLPEVEDCGGDLSNPEGAVGCAAALGPNLVFFVVDFTRNTAECMAFDEPPANWDDCIH